MRTLIAGCLAAGLSFTLPTQAQESVDKFPSRPIRLIVPYTAGGSADVIARSVAQHMSTAFKQPVIVDNKPGADGVIGADAVAKAPADGYTLLFGPNALYSIFPQLHPKATTNVRRDLDPVAAVTSAPMVMAVPASLPVRSVPELIAYAKAHPGQVSFGSAGNSSLQRMIGESVALMADVKMIHVPYKGTSQAATDLAAEQIQVLYGSTTSIEPLVKAGKARIIAVTSAKRFPVFPELPSIGETIKGWPDLITFQGVFAPKGTPAPVVGKIAAEVARAAASPDFQARLKANGFAVKAEAAAPFKASLERDYQTMSQVIKAANIESEE
ncbi:tripartite tricarboxylate transporter substrate binding protein [Variovorax sp. J31P207]|uniref:Bug family tripartite tricarboxylate transporter substrate binding protein n=1 Tax=Variovorax sp. J31P207 TaxID=3053510 RepID=UPI0025778A2A|nr:tripartite tricarboxylate transporter substrate binding protein [Variovorax sp. J31P207]MDM0072492.1 tripartite tricarboxylate transporter substrate binding protein [Variovorax sp. J31P207]